MCRKIYTTFYYSCGHHAFTSNKTEHCEVYQTEGHCPNLVYEVRSRGFTVKCPGCGGPPAQ